MNFLEWRARGIKKIITNNNSQLCKDSSLLRKDESLQTRFFADAQNDGGLHFNFNADAGGPVRILPFAFGELFVHGSWSNCEGRLAYCYIFISIPTPAGKSKWLKESIVLLVGFSTTSIRLWVKIWNCSRAFLST